MGKSVGNDHRRRMAELSALTPDEIIHAFTDLKEKVQYALYLHLENEKTEEKSESLHRLFFHEPPTVMQRVRRVYQPTDQMMQDLTALFHKIERRTGSLSLKKRTIKRQEESRLDRLSLPFKDAYQELLSLQQTMIWRRDQLSSVLFSMIGPLLLEEEQFSSQRYEKLLERLRRKEFTALEEIELSLFLGFLADPLLKDHLDRTTLHLTRQFTHLEEMIEKNRRMIQKIEALNFVQTPGGSSAP